MHIEAVLQRCGWRINGPGNAAERLGIHPNTLRFRMKKLGVVGPAERARHHGASTPMDNLGLVARLFRRRPATSGCGPAAANWPARSRAGRVSLDVSRRAHDTRTPRRSLRSASMPARSADTRSARSTSTAAPAAQASRSSGTCAMLNLPATRTIRSIPFRATPIQHSTSTSSERLPGHQPTVSQTLPSAARRIESFGAQPTSMVIVIRKNGPTAAALIG